MWSKKEKSQMNETKNNVEKKSDKKREREEEREGEREGGMKEKGEIGRYDEK